VFEHIWNGGGFLLGKLEARVVEKNRMGDDLKNIDF
jgi:hypothetical protein